MPLGTVLFADASHAMLVTLLLRLHDLQVVTLDDALAQYVPEAPHASVITLRNLANQATGLTDYLRDQAFQRQVSKRRHGFGAVTSCLLGCQINL